jgi:alpha-galactosidase
MTKITFIGAGSLGFTEDLVRDILTFPLLQDATLALMDINIERLQFAHTAVNKIINAGGYPAKVAATLDRADALKDADVVLTTILAGSTEIWRHDIEIPKKYGVDTNVGDTRGPSGIFRFLRTSPPCWILSGIWKKYAPRPFCLITPILWRCCALPYSTRPTSPSPAYATRYRALR